jgi:hypothetical protein
MTASSVSPQLMRGRSRTGMSAFLPFSGENRTWRGQDDADDPMRHSDERLKTSVAVQKSGPGITEQTRLLAIVIR